MLQRTVSLVAKPGLDPGLAGRPLTNTLILVAAMMQLETASQAYKPPIKLTQYLQLHIVDVSAPILQLWTGIPWYPHGIQPGSGNLRPFSLPSTSDDTLRNDIQTLIARRLRSATIACVGALCWGMTRIRMWRVGLQYEQFVASDDEAAASPSRCV